MNIDIWPVPILDDNYVWVLEHPSSPRVAVVDPGAAEPVLAALAARGLEVAAVLLTHHHGDHVAGVQALIRNRSVPVYGPGADPIASATIEVRDGQAVELDFLKTRLEVLSVPGHTRGHVAYVEPQFVLSGDTLFAGGCGRVFEGTMEQMYESLCRLAALPEHTRVYCAHEYTAANLRFAQAVEPHNPEIEQRIAVTVEQRARGEVTLPSTIGLERRTNPFLRCEEESVVTAARARQGGEVAPGAATFAVIRSWKDRF